MGKERNAKGAKADLQGQHCAQAVESFLLLRQKSSSPQVAQAGLKPIMLMKVIFNSCKKIFI